jgi:hypothetical protein
MEYERARGGEQRCEKRKRERSKRERISAGIKQRRKRGTVAPSSAAAPNNILNIATPLPPIS